MVFENKEDYDKIKENDKLSIIGLNNLEPGKPVTCKIKHDDGTMEEISLNHSYNKFQIEWFKAGSALNVLRSRES